MGCKGSKDANADDKKIESDFQDTYLPKFDQLFSQASTVLESCEKIRGGIEDSKEDGAGYAGTDQLKDGKYIETLRVLLWSLSAQGKGKITDLGVAPTSDLPYLTVPMNKITRDQELLYNTFKDYVVTVVESPDDLQTAITKLGELSETATSAAKDIKADIEASSLSMKQKFDAGIRTKKNTEKLIKNINKCKRLQEIVKGAATDLKETVPQIKALVQAADEIGAKAHAEGLTNPRDIFNKFHTGERAEAEEGKPAEKKAETKPAEKKAETKPAEKKPAQQKK
jgi:hypothetical protein